MVSTIWGLTPKGDSKTDSGEAYIVFGSSTLSGNIDLASLATAGVTIYAVDQWDVCGVSVSGAGDINGDGFEDILVGAPDADGRNNGSGGAGDTYLIYGGAAWPATIELDQLGSYGGPEGVIIYGAWGEAGGFSGISVSAAGDVNGDGFDDLLIGAEHANGGFLNVATDAGEIYLIYGDDYLPVFHRHHGSR